MWILGWGAEHVPRLLTGSIGWSEFWNANIFHPDPLALALSEHLFGQVLQILPIYWLTGNIILCYNLLFISTFALSAFGTYLLVRDLTGDKRAAFIAGLVYGFLPYRIASMPHVQVMSSQWMPFALYGINRFVHDGIDAGADRWNRGARDAELELRLLPALLRAVRAAVRGPPDVDARHPTHCTHLDWIERRRVGTLLLTLPFLFPYQEAQRVFGIERPFGEVVQFSANVWSYVTASENLKLWGKVLRYYPHGEGETFLGFVPWLLASVAVASLVRPPALSDEAPRPTRRRGVEGWLTYVAAFLLLIVLTQLIGILSVVIFGGFELGWIRARTPQRLIMQFAIAVALLLAISPRARVEARAHRAIADHARFHAHDPRDVAVARPAAERRRAIRLGLRPLRLALRLRPRLQRRPRPGALRDDRRVVSRDAGRLRRRNGCWRRFAFVPSASCLLPSSAAHPGRGRGDSTGDQPHLGPARSASTRARLSLPALGPP